MIKLIIPGAPMPMQKPCFIRGKIVDLQKERKVDTRICIKGRYNGALLEGPLSVTITFYMPMPRDATMKKRDRIRYTPHDQKPSLTDLAFYYLECSQGILYEDIHQIAQCITTKEWSDDPRIELVLKNFIYTIEDSE